MNTVVCIKHVPDTESTIKVRPDGSGVVTEGLNFVLNPYDEYAVEEAIRVRERFKAGRITVVCVGPEDATKSLRTALAMGADATVHVLDPDYQRYDGITAAAILAAVIKGMEYDLVLCGKQAVDDDCAEVGPALAEYLGIPNVSVVTKLEIADDRKKAVAHREVEGASEIVECALPALFTAQKGLNEPRYPALPAIMKAKKMAIETMTLQDLGFAPEEDSAKVLITRFMPPPERKAGRVLEGSLDEVSRELLRLLAEEAKVI